MLVALDHFGEVVCGSGEGDAFLFQPVAGFFGGEEALLVESEFAVEVVVDVWD